MQKSSLKKIGGTIALTTFLAAVGVHNYNLKVEAEKNSTVPSYLKNHKQSLEFEFQNYWGVKLGQTSIILKGTLPSLMRGTKTMMSYSIGTDSISVDTTASEYDGMEPTDWGLPGNTVKSFYLHEVAHRYTSQIIDSLKNKGMYNEQHETAKLQGENILREKILWEGIAEYVTANMGLSHPLRVDSPLLSRTSLAQLEPDRELRTVGFNYVTPILNEKGLTKGIEAIFSASLPTEETILKSLR